MLLSLLVGRGELGRDEMVIVRTEPRTAVVVAAVAGAPTTLGFGNSDRSDDSLGCKLPDSTCTTSEV